VLEAHYDNVLWDWNGTLLDDADHAVSVMNRILVDHDRPAICVDRYRELFDFPVRTYYERLGLGDDATFEGAARRFVDEYAAGAESCGLRVDARSTLEALVGAGVSCSILSASEQEPLEELVRHFALEDVFDHACGLTDHYAHGKIEVGRDLLLRTGADPSRTLMVGDTAHDHEVADALGIDCVLVLGGHHSEAKLRATGAQVIEGLSGLGRTPSQPRV